MNIDVFKSICEAYNLTSSFAARLSSLQPLYPSSIKPPTRWHRFEVSVLVLSDTLLKLRTDLTDGALLEHLQIARLQESILRIINVIKSIDLPLRVVEDALRPSQEIHVLAGLSRAINSFRFESRQEAILQIEQGVITRELRLLRSVIDSAYPHAAAVAVASSRYLNQNTFYSFHYLPAFAHPCVFDFDTTDRNGIHVTPEGRLKRQLFSTINARDIQKQSASATFISRENLVSSFKNESSSDLPPKMIIAAYGPPVCGKSTALQAICFEEDIRECFRDGIHYFNLGPNIDSREVLNQMISCLNRAGGFMSEEVLRDAWSSADDFQHHMYNEGALRLLANKVRFWFTGKKVLFVVDNVYETDFHKLGFFPVLSSMIGSQSQSAMILSTRNEHIAKQCLSIEVFDHLPATDSLAQRIFCAQSGTKPSDFLNNDSKMLTSFLQVLNECQGIKFCLAIAGTYLNPVMKGHSQTNTSALLELSNGFKRWVSFREESNKVYERISVLARICVDKCWISNRSVSTSLSDEYPDTIRLLEALCVMKPGEIMPFTTLAKLWGACDIHIVLRIVDQLVHANLLFKHTKRVTTSSGSSRIIGVGGHEAIIHLCHRRARKRRRVRAWHRQLLVGYDPTVRDGSSDGIPHLPITLISHASITTDNLNDELSDWWYDNPFIDGYLERNITRHLSESGDAFGLKRLIINPQWILRRLQQGLQTKQKLGGWRDLYCDFQLLISTDVSSSRDTQSLNSLWVLINECWEQLCYNDKLLGFAVFSRVSYEKHLNSHIQKFVNAIPKCIDVPWLYPLAPFEQLKDSRETMKFVCWGVPTIFALTTDQHTAAIASDNFIFIFNVRYMKKSVVQVIDTYGEEIVKLSISHDGNKIQSWSKRGQFQIWDVKQGKLIKCQMYESQSVILCTSMDADRCLLALGFSDCSIELWDTENHTLIWKCRDAHRDTIYDIMISKDGKYIVSGSSDGNIYLRNLENRTMARSLVVQPRTKMIAIDINYDSSKVLYGTDSNEIFVYDSVDGKRICDLSLHNSMPGNAFITSLNMSQSGEQVAAGYSDGSIRLWHINSNTYQSFYGHSERVQHLEIGKDDDKLMSISADETVRIWNTSNDMDTNCESKNSHAVECMAMSRNGLYVACGTAEHCVNVWSTKNGKLISKGKRKMRNWIQCLAISCDGKWLVSGSADGIQRWNGLTGEIIGNTIKGPTSSPTKIEISNDENLIVSRWSDGTNVRWNICINELKSGRKLGKHLTVTTNQWHSSVIDKGLVDSVKIEEWIKAVCSALTKLRKQDNLVRYEEIRSEINEVMKNVGLKDSMFGTVKEREIVEDYYLFVDSMERRNIWIESEKGNRWLGGRVGSDVRSGLYNDDLKIAALGLQDGKVIICRLMVSDEPIREQIT